MDFEKLFTMQKSLDAHIEQQHGLEKEDLFDRKVLALLVELGELANETRCFKFWSLKPSSPRETVLEEYVDGIHFILSLGIECGFEKEGTLLQDTGSEATLTDQFLHVFAVIRDFSERKDLPTYKKLWIQYLELGRLLGFNGDDIGRAYIDKNEVNYKRQQQGY